MEKNVKIICTLGPASLNEHILRRFEAQSVSMVRINLSHVDIDKIEDHIKFLKKFNIPVAIDTEGSQVRTGYIDQDSIFFQRNDIVKIHSSRIRSDSENIYFTPYNIVNYFMLGDLIMLDFNSVLLRVEDISHLSTNNFIKCRVIIEGSVGGRKGVHCDSMAGKSPVFSEKDLYAIELSKKYGIKYFTLSFMDRDEEVKEFKYLYPEAVAYAKIETLKGLQNVKSIMDYVDGILIDRGDLSREIPIEKIPLTQKFLIEEANLANKEVFVASNLLETMATELKPSRSEVNDVMNTILDGVDGFVLTKETAVGKYPVETINILKDIIHQGEIALSKSFKGGDFISRSVDLSFLKETDYLTEKDMNGLLIEPHGGKLVNRLIDKPFHDLDFSHLPRLAVSDDILMDLEQIAIGTFSPLEGFMKRDDYQSVLNEMRLADGIPWPIPIILTLTHEQNDNLKNADKIAIVSDVDNKIYGILEIEDIFLFNKEEFAKKVYGTTDNKHPGIQDLKKKGAYVLGGKINLLRRNHTVFSRLTLTPRQIRDIFMALGWARIVGFHSRNVIHRSHEFIQLQAMEQCSCDGLFVQPVAGKKKKGDYTTSTIVQSYEIMIKNYYPPNRVVLGLFLTYSRYAGPREAIFTALCRKNFGCSHFVVGRDHTGVGNFYHSTASQEIFSQFDDLGIEPVFFEEIGYSKNLRQYVNGNGFQDGEILNISGTEARNVLRQGMLLPDWFMRSEISQLIIDKLANGEEVFL